MGHQNQHPPIFSGDGRFVAPDCCWVGCLISRTFRQRCSYPCPDGSEIPRDVFLLRTVCKEPLLHIGAEGLGYLENFARRQVSWSSSECDVWLHPKPLLGSSRGLCRVFAHHWRHLLP